MLEVLLGESTLEWIIRSEGVFLWPQAALALGTLTLAISALEITRRRVYLPPRFLASFEKELSRGREHAAAATDGTPCPLASATRSGIAALESGSGLPQAEAEITKTCDGQAIVLDRRTGLLATCSHVAMMLGLLGTVCGLVASFMVISQEGPAPAPHKLAEGVSMALCTTIIGLITAIVGLFCHGYVRAAGDRILFEVEEKAVSLVRAYHRVSPQRASGGNSEPEPAPQESAKVG